MNNDSIKLYSYFRSSAAYRVRIALNLKKIDYDTIPISLTKHGGENWSPQYLNINPQGLVPALLCNGVHMTQSMAIIEYLEEKYPSPSLLPSDISERALSRAMAYLITNDIHPLNNLRVLSYLKNDLSCKPNDVDSWYCHWIAEGFFAIEKLLQKRTSQTRYCYGDQPTYADLCLIPQLYNAKRFNCDLAQYPTLRSIEKICNELSAFKNAAPENQIDFKN